MSQQQRVLNMHEEGQKREKIKKINFFHLSITKQQSERIWEEEYVTAKLAYTNSFTLAIDQDI